MRVELPEHGGNAPACHSSCMHGQDWLRECTQPRASPVQSCNVSCSLRQDCDSFRHGDFIVGCAARVVRVGCGWRSTVSQSYELSSSFKVRREPCSADLRSDRALSKAVLRADAKRIRDWCARSSGRRCHAFDTYLGENPLLIFGNTQCHLRRRDGQLFAEGTASGLQLVQQCDVLRPSDAHDDGYHTLPGSGHNYGALTSTRH
jgi:hypothetical protein